MTEKDIKKQMTDRFIRYTKFDTMSDPELCGVKRPTTDGQIAMLEALKKELEELGLETYFGKEFVVKGTLKGNVDAPTIGFMAHCDTASDVNGNNVKAQYHENYDGSDIVLKDGIVIPAGELLKSYKGTDIITSDGTSLLGADDKAGVTVIMQMVSYLVSHPEVKHGDIEVFFTPDEETGSGMDMFPYDGMKSVACYTVDGGTEGEIETECFNAATVSVTFHGNSIHLGSARGILVNAVTMASALVSSLPQAESPEATDGRYGYYCPLDFNGDGVTANVKVYIRDFDMPSFERRIECVRKLAESIAFIYHGEVDVDVHVSYHNMAEVNKKSPKATEAIYAAAEKIGIHVEDELIRGGTDGARLAETSGVPSPNLFTGGANYHSLREWLSVDGLYNSYRLVLAMVDYWSTQK